MANRFATNPFLGECLLHFLQKSLGKSHISSPWKYLLLLNHLDYFCAPCNLSWSQTMLMFHVLQSHGEVGIGRDWREFLSRLLGPYWEITKDDESGAISNQCQTRAIYSCPSVARVSDSVCKNPESLAPPTRRKIRLLMS